MMEWVYRERESQVPPCLNDDLFEAHHIIENNDYIESGAI